MSDHAEAVLLELGPATVRASGSLELTVIPAVPLPEPPAQAAPRRVEVGLTHETWLISISTAMGGVSQIVAPGNATIGLLGLAVGFGWAKWRWRHQGY